jgi:DNA polymerase III epsilon subunit-like protein
MLEVNHKQHIINIARRLMEDNALILDTETTGLGEDDEIVEIAIVDAAETLEFSALIKPSKSIPEGAAAVHGISDAMVERAPAAASLWPVVAGVIRDCHLLAYNSSFDAQMLEQTFGNVAYREWTCLMNMWMHYHGLTRWARLHDVCHNIGIPPGGHRALGDAKAAREVLRWLARQEV